MAKTIVELNESSNKALNEAISSSVSLLRQAYECLKKADCPSGTSAAMALDNFRSSINYLIRDMEGMVNSGGTKDAEDFN